MPKHVPTFKHLIATSHTRHPERTNKERSVTEVINASRANYHVTARTSPAGAGPSAGPSRSREVPPHLTGEERVWTGETSRAGGLIDAEEGGIHPAELLRRSQLAQRQASRSVAGPAPPPSWRPQVRTKQGGSLPLSQPRRRIMANDLRRADRLFAHATLDRTKVGTEKLVEFCLNAVLRHLASEDVLGSTSNPGDQVRKGGDEGHVEEEWKLGDVMREQVGYLESHLKQHLLQLGSFLPEGDPWRLSDKSVKAILGRPDIIEDDAEDPGGRVLITNGDDDTHSTSSWDELIPIIIHHLPLTLHPHPISFLRQTPNLPALSLTSLNLAYSTIPDLEKLVTVLPPALRELSLCGVRLKGKGSGNGGATLADGDLWRRGLGALGRRLMVLTMLDLSDPPLPIAPFTLSTILHPPERRLASLRILGLRGVITHGATTNGDSLMDNEINDKFTLEDRDGSGPEGSHPVDAHDPSVVERRKALLGVIRGGGRQRFIEVLWD